MIPDCTSMLFYEPLRIKTLQIKNFRPLAGTLNINFNSNLNVILGENGSGKTYILEALNILLARRDFELWDLTLFADGQKDIEVSGEFIHNGNYKLSRRKVHRRHETYRATTTVKYKRVTSDTYKEIIKNVAGDFIVTYGEGAEETFYALQDGTWPKDITDNQKLVADTNHLLETVGFDNYRLGTKNKAPVLYDSSSRAIYHNIGSGHTMLLTTALLLATEQQRQHPRVILLNDNFNTYQFCKASNDVFNKLLKSSGLQVIWFTADEDRRERCIKEGILVADLKHHGKEFKDFNISYMARTLIRLQEMSLEQKINHSMDLIKRALNERFTPIISYSGGRDSEALVHLVHQVDYTVPLQFFNTRVELPGHARYMRQRIQEFRKQGVTVHETKPKMTFWQVAKTYGFPLLGKVFKERTHADYHRVKELGVRIATDKCCLMLKELPAKELAQKLGTDLQIMGTRAQESDHRRRAFYEFGDYYYVKTEDVWRLRPLSFWMDEDVLEYIRLSGLPTSPIYGLMFAGSGCWPCGQSLKHPGNNLEVLRLVYPGLWRALMVHAGLGKEIAKLKLNMTAEQLELEGFDLELRLKKEPCFVDRVA